LFRHLGSDWTTKAVDLGSDVRERAGAPC